jgi:hypothetical protein
MTRSSGHALLRATRLIHLYLGIFTTPALIFFAFTGALQTFSLHETTRGSSYKPPAWAVTLGQIHKKQTPVVQAKRLPPAGAAEAQGSGKGHGKGEQDTAAKNDGGMAALQPAEASQGRKHHPLPLKIFFLIVAISLFLSSVSGLYMSYKYTRNRKVVTVLLVLGTVIPVALLFV